MPARAVIQIILFRFATPKPSALCTQTIRQHKNLMNFYRFCSQIVFFLARELNKMDYRYKNCSWRGLNPRYSPNSILIRATPCHLATGTFISHHYYTDFHRDHKGYVFFTTLTLSGVISFKNFRSASDNGSLFRTRLTNLRTLTTFGG